MICTKCEREPKYVACSPLWQSVSRKGFHVFEPIAWSRFWPKPDTEVCAPLRRRNELDDYQDWALEGYPSD